MPTVKVRCPKCGKGYKVDENLLGKKAKCTKPECGETFRLAAGASVSSSSASAASVAAVDEGKATPTTGSAWPKGKPF